MKIAYLCSRDTLPGSPDRRADAFEHDLIVARMREGFGGHGAEITAVAWDGPISQWKAYDAALVGTAWDYSDRVNEFLNALDWIGAAIPLFNSAEIIRWNCRKTYLRTLEERGADLIPTVWLDDPSGVDAAGLFDALDTDRLVFKRQTGGGAHGQFRLRRGEALPQMTQPMMVQPYLQTIEREGELSFIFIDGQLSHALLKRAAPGDYRIQSLYGGTETAIEANNADVNAARGILETLDQLPLYARVDMLRGNDGKLLLMELELIEPYLYPQEGPGVGRMIADALMKRL